MNFNDEITRILNLFLHSNLDLYSIVFSLVIAAVMGFLISLLYRKTHRGLNYEHTFMATLVLLAPIVSIVMLYIRGDLVLSLGLIGSLSIIRFRTPIKDTRDMVFLFWVIAVGLGAGTYNWGVVVISTIFLTLVVALLYFFRYGNSKNTDFVLVVSGESPLKSAEIQQIVKQYAVEARIRSVEQENEKWEIVFELRLIDRMADSAENLIQQLQEKKGIVRVSLLAPQLALPL
jgi:uncharacterized membrane protein YhiD involved in acid resistance